MSALDTQVSPGFTSAGSGGTNTRNQVYLLGTGVALAATTFPALDEPNGGRTDAAWLNFTCDDGMGVSVPFYIITNVPLVSPQDPDPVAHIGLNPTQQCIFVDSPKEWHRLFVANQRFKAIQYSGADAYLRVEMTSALNT